MKPSDFKIGGRLTAGFCLLLLLSLLIGGLGYYQARHLSAITEQMYSHPFTVNTALRDSRRQAQRIETILADLDPGTPQATVELHQREIAESARKVREYLDVVETRYLGDKGDVARAKAALNNLTVRIDEALAVHLLDKDPGAQAKAVTRARQHVREFIATLQTMVDYAENRAKAFHREAEDERAAAARSMAILLTCALLVAALVAWLTTRSIILPLGQVVARIKDVAVGDFGENLAMRRGDEIGELADAFREMRAGLKDKVSTAQAVAEGDLSREVVPAGKRDALGLALVRMIRSLRQASEASARNDWFKTGKNELARLLSGEPDLRTLADRVAGYLVPYLNAQVGALFVLGKNETLFLTGSYAYTMRNGVPGSFRLGQGLVGQAAHTGKTICVTELPEDYVRVSSGLGEAQPRNLVVLPLAHEGKIRGVLELGSLEAFSETKLDFLAAVADSVGQAIATVENQERLRELLEQTQFQTETLQSQQEELRSVNEELEQQAQALRTSEEELRQQQEELQAANEELSEKNEYLERQRAEIGLKNMELENTRLGLEQKARELEVSSRYKSEFLANMSHELRTPLNSLLLLSRNLMDNAGGNLTPDQVEYARIIFRSGGDLLSLINEILDLSKIEAGKMTLNVEDVSLAELAADMTSAFKPMIDEKGLALAVGIDEDLPESLRTDLQRTEQILRNLLSNAVKFCDRGSIGIRFHRPAPDWREARDALAPDLALAVSVSDTGVGIPEDKHLEIFEAFQQADGGTARKYGGTGLGLTISRELAHLLGGDIRMQSAPGQGSTFTLILPLEISAATADRPSMGFPVAPAEPVSPSVSPSVSPPGTLPGTGHATWQAPRHHAAIPDDRDSLDEGEPSILIIEDDPDFAKVLADQCRAKGLKVLVAGSGEDGLELARRIPPGGIILDIKLPGMNGWQVLDELKHDPALRHIPVHVMSGVEAAQDALRRGAVGFLSKPANRESLDEAFSRMEDVMLKKIKDLLLVEDDPDLRRGVIDLIADPGLNIVEAVDGDQALALMRERRFDCMILDLGLPDMSGFELLERLETELGAAKPPVIVYTGRELSRDEERTLRAHADSIIIKGARSEERLIDETALFLHQMVKTLPVRKRDTIMHLYDKDAVFKECTVLLVDDDMRNLFALSQVLQAKGLTAIKAEDGQKALDVLASGAKVDLVLMDIMMPGMDGYETIGRIRAQKRFKSLPIIALTAKAMLADREKCMQAGASDYLSKPVDVDRLMSVMRVWLYK
ncbi:MAG: response regulator [Proteobacteria bacterium]|nr:response regulator [Pseudomonadota bacterium]